MSASARTIFFFSFYVFAAGLPMVVAPELVLGLLQLPIEGLDWIRFLGVVVLIVGYYYCNLGRAGVVPFFCWSVQMRILIVPVFVALILVFGMRPFYIAFVVPDFLGALWTWSALRKDGINPLKPPAFGVGGSGSAPKREALAGIASGASAADYRDRADRV